MPFSCSRAQDPDRSGSNPSCTGTIHTQFPKADRTRTSMLELSLHTTSHWPSQPTTRQNASDRMCRRSLGCIPPGVATQPDLGRSDFAIPLPGLRQRGEVGTRSRGSPTNGAPRDAPEPDSQCQKNRCQATLPSREKPDIISHHPNPSDRR